MQIKEKLDVFYESTIEVAKKESHALLEEYQASIQQEQEEFKSRKSEELEIRFQMEETRIRRELNSRVSREITRQKRELEECQQDKKQKLFAEVKRQLAAYRDSSAYEEYLADKIAMAKEFAGQEEITIYLNRDDAEKKEALEQKCGVLLTMSEQDFGGGIRAVIRSRNVLIDESFSTKLKRELDAYTL